jgi:A/G-specific adenine glycosylase
MLTALQDTPSKRKTVAQNYVSGLDVGEVDMGNTRFVASYPPLVHVFTHLKLTMHAYQYRIADDAEYIKLACEGLPARRWVDTKAMDDETLSTGMRKCWDLVSKSG